ncbi:Bromodomain-containing protein [Linnemannia elongata]|nr:Bromodomain-containing protein [Linnemannia elongata]
MSSSRRNSKQISPDEDVSMQAVKSPETTKLKLKLKQPEQAVLPENDVRKMFLAVEENDTKALRLYLTQRNVHPDTLFETNIFEENTFTWSALHAAAYYGAKDVVDLLMEFNANVELEDTWYKGRPLAWAAFGGHLDVAKQLIEKYGADKKAKNEHGQVALELVYESSPEWDKMFAETKSTKAGKPKRNGDDKDVSKPQQKESKPGKEGKNILTIPASPLVGAFNDLYKLILNHKDKTGRELAEIFLALPSKDEYPEYYEVIKSPMSLQLVQARIKNGHYKNVDDFDREFQLIFENALIFNEDGSRINKDARVLLKLFNTRKKDIYSSYKLVDNPKASAVDK